MLFIFSLVTGREPNKVKYSTVKCNVCVKSTKNLLLFDESKDEGASEPRKHYVIQTQKTIRGNPLLAPNHSSKHDQTRQWYHKSPTSKIYTTWARILTDHSVFCTLREGGKTVGSNAPGAFLVSFNITSFALFLCLNDRLNIKFSGEPSKTTAG